MILHPPFFISARLAPAIRIGNATLSLVGTAPGTGEHQGRLQAHFVLDTLEFEYEEKKLYSGVGGVRSTVELFETFLGFMEACADGMGHRHGEEKGENADLFPLHVAEWCADYSDVISMARLDITVEGGESRYDLIEEEL